jgi:hypothetical protein
MNTIHEIIFQNPITHEVIDAAISSIYHDTADCLLLDMGNHQFQSLAELKYLQEALEARAARLLHYRKIALLHPKSYSNVSLDPEHYQYFGRREEAIAWLSI